MILKITYLATKTFFQYALFWNRFRQLTLSKMEGTKIMDEKVRNITLDQKYTLHIYIITITLAFAKSSTFQWRFLAFATSFTSFFWVTPAANEFTTYSGSLWNCNPLDRKSTIFFLMPTLCIWIRKILLCNKGLSPTTCLVYSTFCVLKESIMHWWNGLQWSTFCCK